MKQQLFSNILLFLLVLSAGCAEEELSSTAVCGNDVSLSVSAHIGTNSIPLSRALISGDKFPSGTNGAQTVHNLGSWICFHEEEPSLFEESKTGYNHVLTQLTVKGTGKEYDASTLFVFRDRQQSTLNVTRNTAVDIYSYFPYNTGLQYNELKPDRVPFTVGTKETDWMWAKTSIPASQLTGAEASATLVFSHAMTCIRLIVNAKEEGTTMSSITLHDEKGRLYTSGIMNLATQTLELDEDSKTDNLVLNFGRGISSTANEAMQTVFYIIMPQINDFEEGDMTLSFKFNGKDGENTYTIPGKMDNGAEISSFEQGKCYTYRLTLDNTIRFSPIGVDDTWNTQEYKYLL